MKRFLLLTFFSAAVCFLCSCNDSRIGDSSLIRRLRLRNTPEAVSRDFLSAMQDGDAARLLALSAQPVRQKLFNELALAYPQHSRSEQLKFYGRYIKKEYAHADIQLQEPPRSMPEEEDDPQKPALYRCKLTVSRPGKEKKELFLELRQDRYGNWRNFSRL